MDSVTQDAPTMVPGSVSDADRLELTTTAPCYLLGIAAELRNGIYGLAFTTNGTEVDLLNGKPPSPALLQCCKQISEEATGIFRAFVDDYYETKKFRLALNRDEEPLVKLEQVARRFNFQSMKKLRLEFTDPSHPASKTMKFDSEANNLMWCYRSPLTAKSLHIVFFKPTSGRTMPYHISEDCEAERHVALARIVQDRSDDLLITSVKEQVEFFCR